MDKQGLYKGYSSVDYAQRRTFALTDLELVKRDLMNHIYTRRGSRRMMSDYGTMIPDVPFELLTESLIEAVYSDLERVFDADPRVDIIRINVTPAYDNNALTISALLRYVELNVVDALTFDVNVGN